MNALIKSQILAAPKVKALFADAVSKAEVQEAIRLIEYDTLHPQETAIRLRKQIHKEADQAEREKLQTRLAAFEGSSANHAKVAAQFRVQKAREPVREAINALCDEAISQANAILQRVLNEEHVLHSKWGVPHKETSVAGSVRKLIDEINIVKTSGAAIGLEWFRSN